MVSTFLEEGNIKKKEMFIVVLRASELYPSVVGNMFTLCVNMLTNSDLRVT